MTLGKILKLGNPLLHQVSDEVQKSELEGLYLQINELQNLILLFREKYGIGRAIAAPQVGCMKRIICINTDKCYTLINPVLHDFSKEMFEIWDDCMSFPGLFVKVKRHKKCKVSFYDQNWNQHTWELNDDLSELLQHEFDHLNGILATQRAVNDKSLKFGEDYSVNLEKR